jgi:glycosyltransferase involved in cell wall biosynthesis
MAELSRSIHLQSSRGTSGGMGIAVIIPAYNGARFIRRALESVLGQTRKADEIIVVDDGSTDATPEIVAEYPVTLIRKRNGGVSSARNSGIRRTTAEWIALLDQDDWYHPRKLEIQERSLTDGVVASYCAHWIVTGDHEEFVPCWPEDQLRETFRYRQPVPPLTVIMHRAAVLECGGFNEQIMGVEDWELYSRLIAMGNFVSVPEPLGYRLEHGDNYSQKPDKMLAAVRAALPTLLRDVKGVRRIIRKMKVLAGQYTAASLMCRGSSETKSLRLALRGVALWPLPTFDPGRWKVCAVQVLRTMGLVRTRAQ